MIHAKPKTHPLAFVAFIILVIIAAMVFFKELINIILPAVPYGRHFVPMAALEFLEAIQYLNVLLTSVNSILLTYLLYTYVSIYQTIRSQFSLGLIALASALLAHTISSNPIVSYYFGFNATGMGPFGVIPAIFTFFAALVLLYLSRQ